MNVPMEGGCQCGAVRYSITSEPVVVYACHCTTCQTQSGSAFGLAARFEKENFELTQGELASFQFPGTQGHSFTNSFCQDCGTRIHHVHSRFPNLVSLKPGTLDDTSWLIPTFHVYTRSAQPWMTIPDTIPSFETMPDDRSIFGGKRA
jgi:hypothetical protein